MCICKKRICVYTVAVCYTLNNIFSSACNIFIYFANVTKSQNSSLHIHVHKVLYIKVLYIKEYLYVIIILHYIVYSEQWILE